MTEYKKQVKHSAPVAYAFKGDSMKVDTMRHMIRCVLDRASTFTCVKEIVSCLSNKCLQK